MATEWIQTDDYQWQRKVDAGWAPEGHAYEMYEAVYHPAVERWFVDGGTFTLSEYDRSDIRDALALYGYDSMKSLAREYGERYEDVLAEMMFETSFGTFGNTDYFGTEEEAVAYLGKLMKG